MASVHNLGPIDGPLLVFGGPCSNVQATRALLAEAETLGIPRERMLCSGDLVAYCADPQATVDLIRAAGIPVVMGNCEESLGEDAEDCGCGFKPGSSCDLLSVQWYRYAVQALDQNTKAWMRGLPRRIDFTLGGLRLAAVHGGVEKISRFVFPATPAAEKAEQIAAAGVDGVIGGHSGLPFTEVLDGRLWHNAGVIGMPANDGTPRVWYSLLRSTGRGIEIEHRALAYDHAAAAAAMAARDLPSDYARTLVTGIWPADDVMPEADRRRCGQAIVPHSLVFSGKSTAAA